MTKKKYIYLLDILVAWVVIGLPFLLLFLDLLILIFFPEKGSLFLAIFKEDFTLVLAFISSLILGFWMVIGSGAKSYLWEWLPPFVFLKDFSFRMRKIIIALLIFTTLIGVLGKITGLIEVEKKIEIITINK